MRIILRLLGASWRFWLWVLFPPLGWYVSRQARQRRRHNQVLRTLHDFGPGVHVMSGASPVPLSFVTNDGLTGTTRPGETVAYAVARTRWEQGQG